MTPCFQQANYPGFPILTSSEILGACSTVPSASTADKMTPREGVDRPVLGLLSTGEPLCSPQNRRPVQAERSLYPGKTAISGTYAIWETRI